jgi:hypothetical protein
MSSNDYRRIADLLEHVLHHLHELLEILSRDERFREEIIRHLPVPIYVAGELRQAMREELSEVKESLFMISAKIDNLPTTLMSEIIMKGMCPYCHKDLVAYLNNNELRLRCRNQTNKDCKTYAWVITKVQRVHI